jgi:arsenite methyltransferase
MENQRTFFDFAAEVGLTKHFGGLEGTQELARLCHIKEGARVLDIGCGAGVTSCFLAKRYRCRVLGVVERSGERARRAGVADRVEFRNADAYQLPFEDGCFEVVLIESVLTPLPGDKVLALREMIRVLRPGGSLAANETTVDPEAPPELFEAFSKHPATYGYFTAHSLRELFEEAGLQQIQVVETKHVAAPSPLKEMGCGGMLAFFLRTYPKIILTLLRDARFREASRIDDQITKRGSAYTGYTLIVGQVPG